MTCPANPEHRPARPWEARARRTVDLVVATGCLLVLGLPMLGIAAAVRCTSRGPALFRQERVGRRGELFTMFKFRTLRLGGDDSALRELIARELRGDDTAVEGSTKLDDGTRVTRIGSALRSTSLDELPQLLNVLRGEMTLVGPRPCLAWEAEMFPARFAARFDVPPGMTGLWQVSGRSTMGTLDMLRLDVEYVRRRGFWSDLGILARTVPSILRRDGAR